MTRWMAVIAAIALLTTGVFAQTKEYGDSNDHTQCAQVEQPGTLGDVQISVDFEGGIPGTWTVIDNGTLNSGWTITGQDSCALTGNWASPPGSGGLAACSNTDFPGPDVISDTEMITECYDYTNGQFTSMGFAANYRDLLAGDDVFEVDYSTSGDAGPWTAMLSWDANHGTINGPPGELVLLDTSAVDNEPGVQFRYHYYDPVETGWNWYIVLDDIEFMSDGGAITGGGDCTGGGPGDDGGVPATTGVGVAVLVLLLGGGSAYYLRRR